MKVQIKSDKAPQPAGPYSQAIALGNLVFVSGQRPVDPKTGEIVGTTVEQQARQCINNIKLVLEAAGSSLNDVVSTRVYLADIKDFAAFNAIYEEAFETPYPARTTISCTLRGILVEMDAIAEKTC